MKLEVGHTYLTPSGDPVRINHVQAIMDGRFLLYRERTGSTDFWFESGGHSSGADSLKLIMEMPVATPAPTPAPTAAPPVSAAPAGVLRIEIELPSLVVRSATFAPP